MGINIKKIKMRIKTLSVAVLWVLIGFVINGFFDPNTVVGSIMGSIFVLVWSILFFVGFVIWVKYNKKK